MKRVMDLVSRGLYGKMRWLSPHPCLRSQNHRCNSYIQFPRCLDRERSLHLEASSETVARHFRPGRRASPPSGADAAAAVRPRSWPPKRSRRLVFPLEKSNLRPVARQRECATARRPTSGLRPQPNKFRARLSYILICAPAAQRPRHPRVMLWSARMHPLRRKYIFYMRSYSKKYFIYFILLSFRESIAPICSTRQDEQNYILLAYVFIMFYTSYNLCDDLFSLL